MPEKIKAVLFDLDGTLVDSFNAWFYVYNDTLKQFGFPTIAKEIFRKHFGSPIEKDVKEDFPCCTINQVAEAYNKNFQRRINLVEMSKNVMLTLKKLNKNSYKIGLITGSTKTITNKLIKKFDLGKYFDVVLTMNDVKHRKPAPDVVLKACKILKCKPESALVVGDTKNDMLAGKSAGCITIGYKINGDYTVKNLNEILDIVQR